MPRRPAILLASVHTVTDLSVSRFRSSAFQLLRRIIQRHFLPVGGGHVVRRCDALRNLVAAQQHCVQVQRSTTNLSVARPVDGTDYTITANRHSDPAAYTETFTFPGEVSAIETVLHCEFYTQPDARGDLVGSATASVTSQERGT